MKNLFLASLTAGMVLAPFLISGDLLGEDPMEAKPISAYTVRHEGGITSTASADRASVMASASASLDNAQR